MVGRHPGEKISKVFSSFPLPDLSTYTVVAEPEGQGKGFWTGGCSSLRDDKGSIWLIYRLRNPKERGHTLCITTSQDGINFRAVKELKKVDFGEVESLERASLVRDPFTGKYKLYLSLEKEGRWYLYKLNDVSTPGEFNPSTAQPVFSPSPEAEDTRKVKDPYIVHFLNTWHMFYSGSGKEPQEETFLAISQDGVRWTRRGKVFLRGSWHNYHTRMSCVISTGKGFLCLYEGSSSSWHEPHFNLNIGLGYTVDMEGFFDLTPQGPFLCSPTGKNLSTVRYLDYVFLKDKVLFYYEAARDDDAFELRATQGRK